MASKEKKAKVIDRIQESMAKATICVLTDYRGLTTSDVTDLRRKLREAGIEYKVVKNTLARFAAERSGKEELVPLLQGPVAIAFGFGDVVQPARVLTDYVRTAKTSLEIKGGLLGKRVLTRKDLATLATLPSREILLGRVIGGIQSPLVALVNTLNSPIRGLVMVLQARMNQMEAK